MITHQIIKFPSILLSLLEGSGLAAILVDFCHPQHLHPLLKIRHSSVELGDKVQIVDASEVSLWELERIHLCLCSKPGNTFKCGPSEILGL